jgi:LPP20 lipoprotein
VKSALVALVLAAACGSAPVKPLPAWYGVATAEHPRYPHRRFLTGEGLGVSQDEADQRARANVSAQISAQLQSETSSFQQYTSKTGDTAESVTSRVSVRSDFDRADLIAIVDRQQQGGTFYAYAALDRAATDRELQAAADADLASFRAAAQSAKQARGEQNTGVFASAASEAARLRPRLDASFIVRRAVAGRPAPEETGYVALRNELLALLEEARAHRVVGVVLKNGGNGHLIDFTVNAVKHLGLRPDNVASCEKREKKDLTDATELEVAPEESCSEGSLGERCEVVVRLTALACSGGTSGAGTVSMVRGIHPSDRDKARKSAWDKVTPQAVEAAVREALKSAIQIGE